MTYTYNFNDTRTEDRDVWYSAGNKWEEEFVTNIAPQFGWKASLNNKENKYAPDLKIGALVADLKYSESPFITATRYGIGDPRFAHSFNVKDYIRYRDEYPDILLIFWHNFKEKYYRIGTKTYEITPLNSVWAVPFISLYLCIKNGDYSIHTYARRVNDTRGNAKQSYVLNLEDSVFTLLGNVA